MDYQQLLAQKQLLHKQAIASALKENEEQVKFWTDYKKRHEKVIEGLDILPKELSMNCMVPVGKFAMMKGKLCHTNEILIFLGDGYFAKYSAPQAVQVCKRRIDRAEKMLKSLEKERYLWEVRDIASFQSDVFGNSSSLPTEYWEEEKLAKWRVEHREREKNYREKLAQLKSQSKNDIVSDEDLFRRLDELELQEELNDELNRLKEQRSNFYDEELQSGEVYYESDEDSDVSSEDEELTEQIQQELDKLRSLKERFRSGSLDPLQEEEKEVIVNNVTNQKLSQSSSENAVKEGSEESTKDVACVERTAISDTTKIAKKELSHDASLKKSEQGTITTTTSLPVDEMLPKRRVSFSDQQVMGIELRDSSDENSENDIDRINFSHSDCDVRILESKTGAIESPIDFYKKFCKPKSILKRSSNDLISSDVRTITDTPELNEEEEEDDNPTVEGESLYEMVVKDIQEKKFDQPKEESPKEFTRPVSRFKMERSKLKK